jgi:hypothetical protein
MSIMSRKVLVSLLLVIVSALLAIALFIAGAIWRARVTSHQATRSGATENFYCLPVSWRIKSTSA